MDQVKAVAEKHGYDWKPTLAGIQKELQSLNSFNVMTDIKKDDIPAGAKVIGTTLVLKQRAVL